MVIAQTDGWLIPAGEAETMTAAELEQALLKKAWDELQQVPSYVERERTARLPEKE